MQKKKIAIVGLGDIARKAYLPVLAVDGKLDVFLYNRSPEPLQRAMEQYHITAGSSDFDEVMAARPQAAFVLTSSSSHYDITMRLLQAGIDVYLEKPATLHSWQTQELAEMAEQQGRVLMVGFNRRYAPLHVKAKELWGEQRPGMGVFKKFRSTSSFDTLQDRLSDDTIHQIDLLRYYCGEGRALSAAQQIEDGILLGFSCEIALESGGIAVVMTHVQAGRWQENYALYGNYQTLEIEAFSQLRFDAGQENRCWQESYASSWKTTLEGRGFTKQIAHFLQCVETRQTPLTSARDSVKTQLLLEDILRVAGAAAD